MADTVVRNQLHPVAAGEDIVVIAQKYGFRTWQTIYGHDKNAAFRAAYPDPMMLVAGSEIWIPEFTTKQVTVQTGQNHPFVLKTLKSFLHLILEDEHEVPYADIKYEIWIEGQKWGTEERRTDASGLIHVEVPIVDVIELRVWYDEGEEPKIYNIEMGALEPLDTVEGVQDRLNNLGFGTGDDELGTVGPNTIEALKAFQEDMGLVPTGEIDDQTLAALNDFHDDDDVAP